MNPYIIIPLSAIFINSILITYVLGVGMKSEITKAYLLFVFSITLWEISELFLLSPALHTAHLYILKSTAPLYLSPGFLFLNFVQKLTNRKNNFVYNIFFAGFVIAVVLAMFTNIFTKSEINYFEWGLMMDPGILYFPVIIFVILVPAFYAILLLGISLIKAGETIYRRQIIFVIIGIITAIIAGIATNLILPFILGIKSLPMSASSLLAIHSVFMFFSIIRYRFLSPTIKDFAYNLFSQINDGVVVLNWKGNIIEINDHALQLLPAGSDKIIGGKAEISFPFTYSFNEDFTNREVHYDIEGRRYSVVLSQISLRQSGLFIGKLVVIKDISERLRMEEELVKASKIESLGVLAGGIAHDFNNLLTAIVGNISLARLEERDATERNRILDDAEKASLNAKNLTHQLLTFAKGGSPVKKIISMRKLIDETANFVFSGSSVKSSIKISDSLHDINADEGQITQVLHNIIINALQAMGSGGNIMIDAENVSLDEKEVPPLAPGEYVRISVKDEGDGISAKDLPFIFDPFYTTKKTGTGLGLAISYSIIKRHGGLISVKSVKHKGSAFIIYLPAGSEKAEVIQAAPAIKPDKKGRVLIMDDEPHVLNVGEMMLQKLGYSTVTAASGSDAVSIFKNESAANRNFDFVILDLTIPGDIGGKETMVKLMEIDPSVVAIVSSGYSNDPVMAGYKDYGFSGILCKPFTFQDLQSALASAKK